MTSVESEKIPMLYVYKQNDQIKLVTTRNVGNFELYGFLKPYLELLERDLKIALSKGASTNGKYDVNEDEFPL